MMNLPNLLTSIRILLIPVFVVLFLVPTPVRSIAAAGVFTIASLTDLLDGYLARRWKQITEFGKLLDPIADKLLVLSALILLVDFDRVPAWIAIVLIGREIAIMGLRAVAAVKGIVIPAEKMGKYKLFLQVLALVLLMLENKAFYFDFHFWGTLLLWISLFLSISSAIQYTVQYGRATQMKGDR